MTEPHLENAPVPNYSLHSKPLDLTDHFPGFRNAAPFLKQHILDLGLKRVADLGGGANPMLDRSFIEQNQIDYTVLDIEQVELDKAPGYCHKVCIDAGAPLEEFIRVVGEDQFDLVFSHMFCEHVQDPMAVHRNIRAALKPGRLAIHFFPAPYNLPLAMNWVLPDSITSRMLRVSQPRRDVRGLQRKFPAYYKMCEPPSDRLRRKFAEIGFEVVQHTGYIGHGYYDRFRAIRPLERIARKVLLKLQVPMISYVLLVLRKVE